MNDTIQTITLKDGTVIHTAMNGNNYIVTDDEFDETVLTDENLSDFDIDGESMSDMHCTNIWTEDGKPRFIIRELTTTEKAQKALNSAISANASTVTDVEIALAEVYEMILGGN